MLDLILLYVMTGGVVIAAHYEFTNALIDKPTPTAVVMAGILGVIIWPLFVSAYVYHLARIVYRAVK